MDSKPSSAMVLKQIDILERELIKLKRDILHGLVAKEKPKKLKPSLFGSVKGGDVTDELIEQSKQNLFRNLTNI
jgi:hypothetical protein